MPTRTQRKNYKDLLINFNNDPNPNKQFVSPLAFSEYLTRFENLDKIIPFYDWETLFLGYKLIFQQVREQLNFVYGVENKDPNLYWKKSSRLEKINSRSYEVFSSYLFSRLKIIQKMNNSFKYGHPSFKPLQKYLNTSIKFQLQYIDYDMKTYEFYSKNFPQKVIENE